MNPPNETNNHKKSDKQSIRANKGGVIRNVVQAIIRISDRAWVIGAVILVIPIIILALTYYLHTENPNPVYMNIKLIGGYDLYLVAPNAQISSDRIPFIDDNVSSFLTKSIPTNTSKILWPSIISIQILLTSPVGSENYR